MCYSGGLILRKLLAADCADKYRFLLFEVCFIKNHGFRRMISYVNYY